jgi:hypothetical protein
MTKIELIAKVNELRIILGEQPMTDKMAQKRSVGVLKANIALMGKQVAAQKKFA